MSSFNKEEGGLKCSFIICMNMKFMLGKNNRMLEGSSINQRDVDVMMDDKLFVNIKVYGVFSI